MIVYYILQRWQSHSELHATEYPMRRSYSEESADSPHYHKIARLALTQCSRGFSECSAFRIAQYFGGP